MIKDAYWDYDTMEIVLMFDNGQELRISIYTFVASDGVYFPLDWFVKYDEK